MIFKAHFYHKWPGGEKGLPASFSCAWYNAAKVFTSLAAPSP
jgi:hypothetical protein